MTKVSGVVACIATCRGENSIGVRGEIDGIKSAP